MAFGQGMPQPPDGRQRIGWFGEANRHETPDALLFSANKLSIVSVL
jgi:hypothetical protein